MKLLHVALLAVGMCAAPAVHSAVLVEVGPPAGTSIVLSNRSDQFNWLVPFTLTSAAQLTAFEILTLGARAAEVQQVTIKIRRDESGAPAGTNLLAFDDTLASTLPFGTNGQVWARAEFADVELGAGRYWIGMSGASSQLGWTAFNDGIGETYRLLRDDLDGFGVRTNGMFPYRLEGELIAAVVPEPAAWATMIAGFAFAGVVIRGRRRPASARA